jgi:hypothetical protein
MIMRNALALSMVVLLAFAGGCAKTGHDDAAKSAATDEVKAAELTPEQLGELGAQIKKSPDRAQELLSQHGLTEQAFESQIRKVTEDPDASKRYAEAYRKASA